MEPSGIQYNKAFFGFEDDVMLRAAYVNPQGAQFLRGDVTNSYSTLSSLLIRELFLNARGLSASALQLKPRAACHAQAP
eukprot:354079-Pelagomonas_calceolata.AAC.5